MYLSPTFFFDTPVLDPDEAPTLLDSIDRSN